MEPNAIAEQYAGRVAAALAVTERISPDLRETKGATEQWSVKDLLGHCAYWDGVHVAQLEAEFAGEPIPEDDREDDVINAEQFANRADWSWKQVMDEVTMNRDRLTELLRQPSRYDQSDSGGHWDEHRQQIQDWVTRHRADQSARVN